MKLLSTVMSGRHRPGLSRPLAEVDGKFTTPQSAKRSRLAAGAIGKLNRAGIKDRTSVPAPLAEVRA
jgi:hypothetical protein